MLTTAQARAGLFVTGSSGGGSGGITESWVEERFVPRKPLGVLGSTNISNEIKNEMSDTALTCTDSGTHVENKIKVSAEIIDIHSAINSGNYSYLIVRPDGIQYRKKTGDTITDSEVATLADIPAATAVTTDNDTIQGDGTENNPIKLKKVYLDRTMFTGDGLSDATKIQIIDRGGNVVPIDAVKGNTRTVITNEGSYIDIGILDSQTLAESNIEINTEHILMHSSNYDILLHKDTNETSYFRGFYHHGTHQMIYQAITTGSTTSTVDLLNFTISSFENTFNFHGRIVCSSFCLPKKHSEITSFATENNWDAWSDTMLPDAASVKWAILNKSGGGYVPETVRDGKCFSNVANENDDYLGFKVTVGKPSVSDTKDIKIDFLLEVPYMGNEFCQTCNEKGENKTTIYLEYNNTGQDYSENTTTYYPDSIESILTDRDASTGANIFIRNELIRQVRYDNKVNITKLFMDDEHGDFSYTHTSEFTEKRCINIESRIEKHDGTVYNDITQYFQTEKNNKIELSVGMKDMNTVLRMQGDRMTFLYQQSIPIFNAIFTGGTTNKATFTINGTVVADNIKSMTVLHMTEITNPNIGRFCEATGHIWHETITITDCICTVELATSLTTRLVGIITSETQFASHGDVLVQVDDGSYCIGDLLVPTATGAKVATEEEKLFIMINGLPRVRVMSIGDAIPKINDKVCVACFMS
jgi:hypothetical protein